MLSVSSDSLLLWPNVFSSGLEYFLQLLSLAICSCSFVGLILLNKWDSRLEKIKDSFS